MRGVAPEQSKRATRRKVKMAGMPTEGTKPERSYFIQVPSIAGIWTICTCGKASVAAPAFRRGGEERGEGGSVLRRRAW